MKSRNKATAMPAENIHIDIPGFIKYKYDGYYVRIKTKQLYSLKTGVLTQLKYHPAYRKANVYPGYQISYKGTRIRIQQAHLNCWLASFDKSSAVFNCVDDYVSAVIYTGDMDPVKPTEYNAQFELPTLGNSSGLIAWIKRKQVEVIHAAASRGCNTKGVGVDDVTFELVDNGGQWKFIRLTVKPKAQTVQQQLIAKMKEII